MSGSRHTYGDTLVCATYAQREMLLRRIARLDDGAWDGACPAPRPAAADPAVSDRTIRDVVAHLLVVDEMILRGGALRVWTGIRRLEHPGAWDVARIQPLASLPVSELVALLARRGARFGRLIAAAPNALRRVPVPGPFGRLPLASVIARRVLHEWLHEHDIAQAEDERPGLPSLAVAGVVADAVLQLLVADGLPRLNLDDGVVRLVVNLTHAEQEERSPRTIWGIDFGRRQYGPRVVTPADAIVRVEAADLALLANSRGDRLGTAPRVEVEGDAALAADVVDALAAPGTPAPCLGAERAAVA